MLGGGGEHNVVDVVGSLVNKLSVFSDAALEAVFSISGDMLAIIGPAYQVVPVLLGKICGFP